MTVKKKLKRMRSMENESKGKTSANNSFSKMGTVLLESEEVGDVANMNAIQGGATLLNLL